MFDDWVSESRKQINVCFIICNMRGNDEESSQKKKKRITSNQGMSGSLITQVTSKGKIRQNKM